VLSRMAKALNHHAVFKYVLIACWVFRGIIGNRGFFKNHHLLNVLLAENQKLL
jgi:hypothetical protein